MITDGDRIEMSVPTSIPFYYQEQQISIIENLHVSEPYFVNGLIKANVSWNILTPNQIQQYDLLWIETQCSADVVSCCYRRDAATIQNHFEIYDLRFNCTYVLNVSPIVSKSHSKNLHNSLTTRFNVSSCEMIQIQGSIRPPCQTDRTRRK